MVMQTEFVHLALSKTEAKRLAEALAASFVIEDEIRAQQGLEAVPLPPLMSRLASLLRLSEGDLENMMDRSAEGLWEYSWYVFTSEWAWFRAQQDAVLQMRTKNAKVSAENPDCRRRAEVLYRKNFEKYAREIDMRQSPVEAKIKTKNAKRKTDD